MEFVEAVRNLIEYVPLVYVEAGLVFVIVSLLKISGLPKKDPFPQFSNALLAFFLNGGKLPDSDHEAKRLFMTMIVAACFYQVWKLLKKYVPKGIKKLVELTNKEE